MKIISKQGDPSLAEVYVARFRDDDMFMAEFVDARDPSLPIDKKWVIIVSTQFGCPIACPMCDAGGDYAGDLKAEEILAQIDAVVEKHGPHRLASAEKFKIQFARMGEPSLNPAVLDVLGDLPDRYGAPGLIPCIATSAPAKANGWFERLREIRHDIYDHRPFQLQLSANSTDEAARDRLMPVKKMSLEELSNYASSFYQKGGRKISLNFALTKGIAVDPIVISDLFDPACTCIKITPLNPTMRSEESGMDTALPPNAPDEAKNLCDDLMQRGFDVILSIGDVRENEIGSNCGMAVRKMRANA
ncbi:MAG: radical SAM protein [Pseudomonadota bacterium]